MEDALIDREEYRVVKELVQRRGDGDDADEERTERISRFVHERVLLDGEGRVCKLDLYRFPSKWGRLESLPPTIGTLQHLTALHLCDNFNLSCLPEEIGDLGSLEVLTVRRFRGSSIPASIGRLRNLQHLDLGWSMYLVQLPKEIGRLERLESLHLSRTIRLTGLPEEIGDLQNLELLDLQSSNLGSLPDSVERLESLKYLNLRKTRLHHHEDSCTALLRLAEGCPVLGHLGLEMEAGREVLYHALARNRSRFRRKKSRCTTFQRWLWPRVLEHAAGSFAPYFTDARDAAIEARKSFGSYCCGYSSPWLGQHDAIYELLIDDRESFVQVLVADRESKR